MESNNNRPLTRRNVLTLSGTALATALAGCNDDDNGFNEIPVDEIPKDKISFDSREHLENYDEEYIEFADLSRETLAMLGETHNDQAFRDPDNQEYDIPPAIGLNGRSSDQSSYDTFWGNMHIRTNAEADTVDRIKFELFVYDTYPVGNEVDLIKLDETVTPLEHYYKEGEESIDFEYDTADVPKDRQIRYRVRAENLRTGESGWIHDQSVRTYLTYGDGDDAYDNRPDTVTEKTDEYIIRESIGAGFPAPELAEELPYSREAYKKEKGEYSDIRYYPEGTVATSTQLQIPEDHYDLAKSYQNTEKVSEYVPEHLWYTRDIPDDVEYYGQDEYTVLDHPLYSQLADRFNEEMDRWGVDNHYARIKAACEFIQTKNYEEDFIGTGETTYLRLPEEYLIEQTGDCVDHTYNLVWLLYHLGYTVSTVSVWDWDRFQPVHQGAAVQVPEEVIEEQFPERVRSRYFDYSDNYYRPINDLANERWYTSLPTNIGDDPFLYLEATAPHEVGRLFTMDTHDFTIGPLAPFQLEFIAVPDDPWFEKFDPQYE